MGRNDPEPSVVRSQLLHIIKSAAFDASERNRKFLEYVVEEALAGRSDRLKAYNIATSVFGRDTQFDPQNDPVVRIEARRLRRALELFYLTAGKNDDLVISIPKGGYAPTFRMNEANQSVAPSGVELPRLEAEPEPQATFPSGPKVFVAPFEEEGDQSEFPNFTRGFTRTLIAALTRFSDMVVYGAETSLHYGKGVSLDNLRTDLDVDFLVRGGTSVSSERFDIEALMIDVKTGRNLWAESFGEDLTPSNIIAVREEAANRIAGKLAQPFGVIFSRKAQETEGKPPTDYESYDCVIKFFLYWRSIDRELHAQARVCLERAIADNPHYAEAHACLSHVYSDAYRFGFDSGLDEGDPLDRALALAHLAIGLAPSSSRSHQALSQAYWFMGDLQASMDCLETALRLNANDTEIMADLGLRYAMATNWDKAVPLLQEAYRRNPALPGTFRIALSFFHLAHGRYEECLSEARKTKAPQVVYGHLLEAAAAAGLGLREEAESAVSAIISIDPDYGQHIVSDLQKRSLHPDLIAILVDLLERTSLPLGKSSGRVTPLKAVALAQL